MAIAKKKEKTELEQAMADIDMILVHGNPIDSVKNKKVADFIRYLAQVFDMEV